MTLLEFVKMASGSDQNRVPKSTACLCLVELESNKEGEVVSNIKSMLTLLSPEILINFFVDGRDENGYIEVRIQFQNPDNSELHAVWNILEEYRTLNLLEHIPIPVDSEIEISSDTVIELMILPKETAHTNPVFLELAFPINFTLCSSLPGRTADSLDLFFNANSCRFHENNYLDMDEIRSESEEYMSNRESQYQEE